MSAATAQKSAEPFQIEATGPDATFAGAAVAKTFVAVMIS